LEGKGDPASVIVARDEGGALVGLLAVRRIAVRVVGTLPLSELHPFGPGLRVRRGREGEAAVALAEGLVSTALSSWDELVIDGKDAQPGEGLARPPGCAREKRRA